MISAGAWAGRRAFVVGGGPSLRGFDFSLLRGEAWIGCNVASRFAPPVALANDRRVVESFWAPVDFPNPHVPLDTHLCWLATEAWTPPAHVQKIPVAHPPRWTASLADGLVNGPTTGLTALHLADVLGASRIYLLGFDLVDDGGMAKNWHDEYEGRGNGWRGPARTYLDFARSFETWAPHVRAPVVNLNPASALTCFPKQPREEVLPCPAN